MQTFLQAKEIWFNTATEASAEVEGNLHIELANHTATCRDSLGNGLISRADFDYTLRPSWLLNASMSLSFAMTLSSSTRGIMFYHQ